MEVVKRLGLGMMLAGICLVALFPLPQDPPASACFVAAVGIFAFGVFVLRRDRHSAVGRAFCGFTTVFSLYLGVVFCLHLATIVGIEPVKPWVWILRNGNLLIPPAMIYFTYRFLNNARLLAILSWLSLASMLPVIVLNWMGRYITEYRPTPWTYVPANALDLYRYCAKVTLFWLGVAAVAVLVACIRSGPGRRRTQYLLFLLGWAFAVVPGLLGFMPAFRRIWYPSFLGLSASLFPLILGVAIARVNLFDIRLVIRRTVPYALLTAAIGLLYGGCMLVARVLADYMLPVSTGYAWVAWLVMVAVVYQPLLEGLRLWADRLFMRREARLDRFLAAAAERYLHVPLPELGGMICRDAVNEIGLEGAAILHGGQQVDKVDAYCFPGHERLAGLRPAGMIEEVIAAFAENPPVGPGPDAAECVAVLKDMGVALVLSFAAPGSNGLMLCLQKHSHAAFSRSDRDFLQALAAQGAAAFAHAREYQRAEWAERLRDAIFESLQSGIGLLNEEGGILSCNRAFSRLVEPQQADGRFPAGLLDAITAEEHEGTFEVNISDRIFLVNTRKLSFAHGRKQQLVVVTEITDMRRLQEENRRRAVLAELGATISSINHEISNILSPVRFYLGKASRAAADEQSRTAIRNVSARIEMLDGLSTELREYYREPELRLRDVELGDLVGRALADLGAANVSAFTHPHCENLDFVVRADPQKAGRAIFNILKNGWDAMREQPEKDWLVTAECHDHTVRLSIRDSGPGIAAEDMDKLFRPFFTTKSEKGTGLGLPIVRRIMEAHGGGIEVDSVEGKGTEVTLVFTTRSAMVCGSR